MSKIKLHKGSPGYGGTKVAADGTYEDLKKAQQYIQFEIERIKRESNKSES